MTSNTVQLLEAKLAELQHKFEVAESTWKNKGGRANRLGMSKTEQEIAETKQKIAETKQKIAEVELENKLLFSEANIPEELFCVKMSHKYPDKDCYDGIVIWHVTMKFEPCEKYNYYVSITQGTAPAPDPMMSTSELPCALSLKKVMTRNEVIAFATNPKQLYTKLKDLFHYKKACQTLSSRLREELMKTSN